MELNKGSVEFYTKISLQILKSSMVYLEYKETISPEKLMENHLYRIPYLFPAKIFLKLIIGVKLIPMVNCHGSSQKKVSMRLMLKQWQT